MWIDTELFVYESLINKIFLSSSRMRNSLARNYYLFRGTDKFDVYRCMYFAYLQLYSVLFYIFCRQGGSKARLEKIILVIR